jgi:phage terminase large subunit GpA-like protein
MNLKLQDEAAFFAEYQNEPLPAQELGPGELTAEVIAARLNKLPCGSIPLGVNRLTMFIDVQQTLLYFVVAGWEDDFTGYVVDYGAYPDQQRAYFTLRDARKTLAHAAPTTGLEGSIYAGLEALTGDCLRREWPREDGAMLRIERCLVDANWGTSTDVVYQFGRESVHAGVVVPCHGRFVGASSTPFSEYRRQPGDQVGHNWRLPSVKGKRSVRHVVFDANYWKSFVYARLAAAMGDRGSLSLYGEKSERHRHLADHLTAEYRVKTEGRGRTVDEWKLRPSGGDNHWFDGLVGCAVGASMLGATLPGTEAVAAKAPAKTYSLRELQQIAQAKRRARRGW